MSKFFKKLGIELTNNEDLDIKYVETFFVLNFPTISTENFHSMNNKDIPSKNPEFTIKIVEKQFPTEIDIMRGNLYNIGLIYNGKEYFEKIPEYVFNWFCYIIEKENAEPLKYKTRVQIDKRLKEIWNEKELARQKRLDELEAQMGPIFGKKE